MSLPCICKRQDGANVRSQRTSIDEPCDLRQLRGCDIDQKEGRADTMFLRKFLIGLRYRRN
jgi:hypothetical protein